MRGGVASPCLRIVLNKTLHAEGVGCSKYDRTPAAAGARFIGVLLLFTAASLLVKVRHGLQLQSLWGIPTAAVS